MLVSSTETPSGSTEPVEPDQPVARPDPVVAAEQTPLFFLEAPRSTPPPTLSFTHGPEKTALTFTGAVQLFIEAATWLSDEHAPALISLVALAQQLDGGDRKPSTFAQFNLAHRALLKDQPGGDDDDDGIDALISQARHS